MQAMGMTVNTPSHNSGTRPVYVRWVTCTTSQSSKAKTSFGDDRVSVGIWAWITMSESLKLSSAPETMSSYKGTNC